MEWKESPIWFKGGIIGLLVEFFLFFLTAYPSIGLPSTTSYIIFWGPCLLINKYLGIDICYGTLTFILVFNIVLSFIIGALIGLIISKIKSRGKR